MLKTLIVAEDYSEMVFLQTLLKKLGFDVDSIRNERALNEALITFNPHVILVSLKSKSKGGGLIEKLARIKRRQGWPKIVHIRSESGELDESLKSFPFDGALDKPVQPVALIRLLSKVGNLDEGVMLDKYQKFQSAAAAGETNERASNYRQGGPESIMVRGGQGALGVDGGESSPSESGARADRAREFLKRNLSELPPPVGVSRARIQEEVRKGKEKPMSQDEEGLLAQKRDFFVRMIKKETS